MPEGASGRQHHISSALVTVLPDRVPAVAAEIARLPMTEVRHEEGARLIVVLEGASAGEIGQRLTTINLMNGVLSATLVFEQAVPVEELEEVL